MIAKFAAGLEDNAYLHVIVPAALAHAQFATIHPFFGTATAAPDA